MCPTVDGSTTAFFGDYIAKLELVPLSQIQDVPSMMPMSWTMATLHCHYSLQATAKAAHSSKYKERAKAFN